MNKYINYLLILLCVSCSTIHQRSPSDTLSCSQVISRIYESTNNYTSRISVQEGSYASRMPGYENKMKKVFSYIPSVKKFVNEYETQNRTLPRNREIFDYIIASNKKVISELNSLRSPDITQKTIIDRVKRSIDYSSRQLNKIERFKTEERSFLERRYNSQTREDKNTFRPFKKEFYGSLGEVDIFMKIKGADGLGIYFKDHVTELGPEEVPHNNALTQAVSRAKNNLQNISEQAYDNLVQRYPLIFDRQGESIDEKVNGAINWIKSKEIDIVARMNNQRYLIEVKNYSKVIDRRTLLDDHGNKSIFTQQKELLELIGFLDLDYRPLIVFRNGVTEDAALMLEEIGFEVLGK